MSILIHGVIRTILNVQHMLSTCLELSNFYEFEEAKFLEPSLASMVGVACNHIELSLIAPN